MVMQDVNYELFAENVKAECSFGIKNPDVNLVAETMAALELTPFSERHPGTLSGGQKQRLAVAVGQLSLTNLPAGSIMKAWKVSRKLSVSSPNRGKSYLL